MNVFRSRSGFTLMELMVVILIISILMGMMIYAVIGTKGPVTSAAVLNEINNLTAAVQNYKSDTMGYPPSAGDAYSNPNDVNSGREARILQHLKLAYPAFVVGSYANLKKTITTNYNYLSMSGSVTPLNLDTLDQAEAVVFWLSGLPTPYNANGSRLASRKLFGFHANPKNPFQLDTATSNNAATIAIQYRTSPGKYFDFDEARLTDYDNDGWLEYVPNLTVASDRPAPYVYFDAALYSQGSWGRGTAPSGTQPIPPYTGYPSTTSSNYSQLMSEWGLAVPYATFVDSNIATAPIEWQNPNSFQIICAGIDGQYGSVVSTAVRLPVFPNTSTFRGNGFGTMGSYDEEEMDNLTNFAERAIGNVTK